MGFKSGQSAHSKATTPEPDSTSEILRFKTFESPQQANVAAGRLEEDIPASVPEHGMAHMDPNMVEAMQGDPVEVPTNQLEKAKEILRESEFESQEA